MEWKSSTVGDDAEILLVEDNPGDARLIEESFHEARISNTLHHVTDGEEALDFLYQQGEHENAPHPALVLLDWNLPRASGAEVLEKVKSDPSLRKIPIVVLTSSKAEEDIITSYDNQANAFVTKPVNPKEFIDVVRSVEDFWLSVVRFPSPTDEERT